MRRLWAGGVLLLVLLAGSLGNAWYAGHLTEQLTQQLERAQELAAQGNWEGAAELSEASFQIWQDHEIYLHVLMRHSDTDEILRSFRGLEQYLALEETDQYTAANAELITLLELLAEMEQPALVNVF